jgi:hypothetical protein
MFFISYYDKINPFLNYSSEGSPALTVFRPYYLETANYTWIFLYPLLYPVENCKKKHRSSIGLKITYAFTVFRAILLCDLVGCGNRFKLYCLHLTRFFEFEGRQTAIIVFSGLPHPTLEIQIIKKMRQMAIIICSR